MSAYDKYIDDLVNGKDTEDGFPKNESSWEELFDFGKRRIVEIVTIRRDNDQLRAERETEKRAYIQYQSYEVALRSELDKKDAALEEARETIRFYADTEKYLYFESESLPVNDIPIGATEIEEPPILEDNGKLAKEWLSAHPQDDNAKR